MAGELFPHDDDWFVWREDTLPPIRVRFETASDGRLHVAALHVEGEDAGPVSSGLLRRIPVGRIEAHANHTLHPDSPTPVAIDPAFDPRVAAQIPSHLFDLNGRGRSDEFYAEVASIYRGLVAHSHPPSPTMATANSVPISTVHRWVRTARDRGHLPPGRSGKAG